MAAERIQKIIANAGLMSRRQAEAAILEGRVKLNGQPVAQLGTTADPEMDELLLDGRPVNVPTRKTVILLNKPQRAVTTKSDPEGRQTVMDLLPEKFRHLNPVGRLDYDSEGLLLLSDDGELTHTLTHPSFGVEKAYEVLVRGVPGPATLQALTNRVRLEDGPGRFERIEILTRMKTASGQENALTSVVVTEGRNRFIRRMFDAVGHPVRRLKRVRLGSLELGALPPGSFRELTADEIERLKRGRGGARI